MKRYLKENFDAIEPVRCPCGWAKRAFALPENRTATFHQVEISADSRVHYHKRMTEMYFILEGEGRLELDGEEVPVKPQDVVMIRPGCRHRAAGKMKIINVAVPAFDPSDEFED
ncbi:MAG: cupin domain-containing protein [Spirochaetia bacterium]|nr:cupin domain-containing protein [Spirochaetia bacterium]